MIPLVSFPRQTTGCKTPSAGTILPRLDGPFYDPPFKFRLHFSKPSALKSEPFRAQL